MAENQASKYTLSKEKYQIKLVFSEDQEEGEEEDPSQQTAITVKFLKLDGENYCIDILRTQGNWQAFRGYQDKIKDYIEDFLVYKFD